MIPPVTIWVAPWEDTELLSPALAEVFTTGGGCTPAAEPHEDFISGTWAVNPGICPPVGVREEERRETEEGD